MSIFTELKCPATIKNQIGFKRRKFILPKIRKIVRKFDQQFSAPENVNCVVVAVVLATHVANVQ